MLALGSYSIIISCIQPDNYSSGMPKKNPANQRDFFMKFTGIYLLCKTILLH